MVRETPALQSFTLATFRAARFHNIVRHQRGRVWHLTHQSFPNGTVATANLSTHLVAYVRTPNELRDGCGKSKTENAKEDVVIKWLLERCARHRVDYYAAFGFLLGLHRSGGLIRNVSLPV